MPSVFLLDTEPRDERSVVPNVSTNRVAPHHQNYHVFVYNLPKLILRRGPSIAGSTTNAFGSDHQRETQSTTGDLTAASKRDCDRQREREREGNDTITSYSCKAVTALEDRRERAAVAPSGHQGLSRRRIPSSASSAPPPPPPASLDPEDLPFWQQNWFLFLLLLMAFSFFAVAVLLYLGLEVPEGSPAPATAAQEGVQITYGSVIKLMHDRTKFRLHSHDVPYGSGSGQQSVTGFPNVDDSNSYWVVKPPPDSSAKQGDVIPNGTIIRLQHMRTRKWLHSHLHASPITGNLEVSCYGGDMNSDTGDFWRLEIDGSGKIWKQDQRVRLQHVDTGGYLHSHDKKYSRIAGGQQEVCGVREKRPDNVWLAAEGVYLPINTSK